MQYCAGWNLPGCLPDIAEPLPRFDSFEEARDYLADRADCVADCYDEGDDYGDRFEWMAVAIRLWAEPFSIEAPDGYVYWVEECESDLRSDLETITTPDNASKILAWIEDEEKASQDFEDQRSAEEYGFALHGSHPSKVLWLANKLLGGFGVEAACVPEDSFSQCQTPNKMLEYVNTGETYDATLGWDGSEFLITSWGDWFEGAELEYSEETETFRCPHCGEWSEYISPDNDRGICCGAINPADIDVDEIEEAAARALFVSSWADREEEEGRTYPGEDLMDVAPETPSDAWESAKALLEATADTNRMYGRTNPHNNLTSIESILQGLCAVWIEAGRDGYSGVFDEEHFGHYLAMEALGHGVGLSDNLKGIFPIKPPFWEYHWEPTADV